MACSLPRHERVRGFRSFSRILSGGAAAASGPIRCFLQAEERPPGSVSVGFAVSREVRGSVRRNRIRRLLREAYRLNKAVLVDSAYRKGLRLQLIILYSGPARAPVGWLSYKEVEKPVRDILHKIERRL